MNGVVSEGLEVVSMFEELEVEVMVQLVGRNAAVLT